MQDLAQVKPKRKLLTLKKERHPPEINPAPPRFINEAQSIYMVWCDGGDMPKRVYREGERSLAESHAKALAEKTGQQFWVMRAWRAYSPR